MERMCNCIELPLRHGDPNSFGYASRLSFGASPCHAPVLGYFLTCILAVFAKFWQVLVWRMPQPKMNNTGSRMSDSPDTDTHSLGFKMKSHIIKRSIILNGHKTVTAQVVDRTI
jgi:hypothetical protein